MPLKFLATLFAIVAFATACGDSEDTSIAADPTITTTSDVLLDATADPNNDAAVSGPAVGTCLAGDEGCQDTGGDIGAPALPDGDAVDNVSGVPIESVEGFFHAGPEGMFLCRVLLESFPAQCGDPIVDIVGLDMAQIGNFIDPEDGGLVNEQGVSWTASYVTLFGELVDGQLNVAVD